MENFMNRIIYVAVVILSLSGFIACSEMELINQAKIGQPSFKGSPFTCGALTPALQVVTNDDITSLQMAEIPLPQVNSIMPHIALYNPEFDCSGLVNFAGPLQEMTTIKLNLSDLSQFETLSEGEVESRNADMLLSIQVPELNKTYYFDSKWALRKTINRVNAAGSSQLALSFEFEKNIIDINLFKVPLQAANGSYVMYWRGWVSSFQRNGYDAPGDLVDLGTFEIPVN